MAVDQVGMNVLVEFVDSRSNRSFDVRAAHFVMDERRQTTEDMAIGRNNAYGVLPKLYFEDKRAENVNYFS